MTVPECMLSVDVEGWKNHVVGYGMLSGLSLGGCATSIAGSSLMHARAKAGALPQTSDYLPVEDLRPKREKAAMTADERSKLQKELITARDRQTVCC